MKKTDIHSHAFHPKIAVKVVQQLKDHYKIDPVGNGLIDDLTNRFDQAGIDCGVVHSAATRPEQVIPANDWAIYVQKTYERFHAFGTIHPDFKYWRSELNRLESNGIRGLKIHADFQGFRLDDFRLWPIFEAAEDRFMLMMHVGDRIDPAQNPSSPKKVARIKRDFPNLKIIAAHLGGFFHWDYVLDNLAGLDIYLDTSSSLEFIDQTLLEKIINAFPMDHILFGSDYPLYDPAQEIDLLQKRLSLNSRDLEIILTNGTRLFLDNN